ncbi:MAG: hypothetical protein ACYDC8_06105 [Gammaproteobacteria bacterium]
MLHRIETTDPMTSRDIDDLSGKPYLVERGAHEDLVIYFESEETRRQYLEIPVENPATDYQVPDNNTEEGIDEG